MTAASGILHEEFHSPEFTRKGGTLEMVQLWVNLPAKDKNAAPDYQTILDRDIASVDLPDAAGTLRVIAGEFEGRRGPAHTFTPIDVWDVHFCRRRGAARLRLPEGHTLVVVVLRGTVLVNGSDIAPGGPVRPVRSGRRRCDLEANSDASMLVLSGEPIDEPVVMHGPFVMNTVDEINDAIRDFQTGRFGEIPA